MTRWLSTTQWPPQGDHVMRAIDQTGFYGNFCLPFCTSRSSSRSKRSARRTARRVFAAPTFTSWTRSRRAIRPNDPNESVIDDVVGKRALPSVEQKRIQERIMKEYQKNKQPAPPPSSRGLGLAPRLTPPPHLALPHPAGPQPLKAPMAGIFKAYDIRGTYPDQINAELAARIARQPSRSRGPAAWWSAATCAESGETLRDAMLRAIAEAGCDVIDIGRVSTPMCYWAVNTLGADGGIMITASHNPARYNGCKISGPGARPVSYDTGIAGSSAEHCSPAHCPPRLKKPGRVEQRSAMVADYQRWLLSE